MKRLIGLLTTIFQQPTQQPANDGTFLRVVYTNEFGGRAVEVVRFEYAFDETTMRVTRDCGDQCWLDMSKCLDVENVALNATSIAAFSA